MTLRETLGEWELQSWKRFALETEEKGRGKTGVNNRK